MNGKIILGQVAVFWLCAISARSYAQLPKDLATTASNVGCLPIERYYDRSGKIYPPYVYDYPPSTSRESVERAVFWCKRTNGRYILVFTKDGQPFHESCPPILEFSDPPGGLSVLSRREIPLDRFVYFNNQNRYGPRGEHSQYALLFDGEVDVAGTYFYCHKGSWLVQTVH